MTLQRAKLCILATTDLHAHVTNYDYYRDQSLLDVGLMGLADEIEKIRRIEPNTLLLDNGDCLQGNPIGNYLRDDAMVHQHPIITLMNGLQYDGATLGNHEFDFGLPYLRKAIQDWHHPVTSANIETAAGKPWLPPYLLLQRSITMEKGAPQPITIGVIGAVPPQVMLWNHKVLSEDPHERLVVKDITASITHYVKEMKIKGADLIVVLSHSGVSDRPYQMGAENSVTYIAEIEGVDAIVAGHAHGVMAEKMGSRAVPVVMPGVFGQYLGCVNFTLTHDAAGWHIEHAMPELIENGGQGDATHPLFPCVAREHALTLARMNAPIGRNVTDFSSAMSLVEDDACIELIAQAQLWYGAQLLASLGVEKRPILSAVPAFKVGGRKNAPHDFTWIEPGILSFKNVADLYPFNNQLAILRINGRDLREWLECANSIYFTIDEGQSAAQPLINWAKHRGYNRDVIKGVEYAVDVQQPRRYNGECRLVNEAARRIVDLTHEGKWVRDEDEFFLITNQYRAYAGKFPGSGEHAVVTLSTDELPTIIAEYLMHQVANEGHIRVVPTFNWQLACRAKVRYETAPDEKAAQYIQTYMPTWQRCQRLDEDGFAIYICPNIE
ncbi:bifunctional 2',3'-cyclic-nucleotide 2'-phosphodiesterase/3'-nucleotidase [Wohlfahrtiimonas chitiniclastica]|uniref:bifunctional 2',3'-cyclic-nucleotide 2'-phosphodiesterase/3'-nucleotidase n=1 Tax=Wohlfahrtiimonas chitiniclastica TaxID=400946 RepID=UPI000B993E1B|nr:bifunctional 2',3'-cyclic-nucleotide 2'-phosphodiesterase/3'-nucleotidase [Wohlfahrtiimonas chitiniclastica]OYQ76308.1 2',3'-cyclic-nucleotide 2'-phosphodiesterase [Wohlfahrtiimonas chitiniclastica]